MATTSYGKITIIDVTDVGNFSVYPYANGPNTQIYSEENSQYYPNWEAQSGGVYSNRLVLTPVVTYAGQDKVNEATVNWYLKTDLEHPITTGGVYEVDNLTKQLKIAKNIPTTNTYVSYVVKAHYVSETGAEVNAQGEISFNLLTQPSSIKNVSIDGDNVIKYASDSTVPNPTQAQLKVTLTGGTKITGDGWKYYTGNGWSTNYISNSGTGKVAGLVVSQDGYTLTVDASYNNSAAYFNADLAKFKYVAHSSSDVTDIYEDIFSVFQLRDGASGSSLVSIDLTNDDQLVPLNSTGVAQWDAIGDLASTTIYVYRGTDNITSENPIKATLTNISSVELYNGDTKYTNNWTSGQNLPAGYYKVKVTGFTNGATSGSILFETTVYSYTETSDTSVQTGTTYYAKNSSTGVYFEVSDPSGNPSSHGWYIRGSGKPCSAIFSLVGAPVGEDGKTPTIYSLEFPDGIPMYKNTPTGSASSQNLEDHFAFSPDHLVLQGYQIETDVESGVSSKNPFGGRVLYKPNIINGQVGTGADEWGTVDLNSTTGQYTFSSLNTNNKFPVEHSPYTFKLVRATDTSTILDQETITINSDGKSGNTGNSGKDSINLLINNENVTLNCTESGETRGTTIVCRYQGYIGTAENSNFALSTSSSYSSSKSNLVSSVNDNNNHDTVTITLNGGVGVSKGETGTITLNFVYSGVSPSLTISKIISWDAKLDAKDGDNAITLSFEYGDGAGSTKQQFFQNGNGFAEIVPVLLQNGSNLLEGKTAGTDYTVAWTNLIDPNETVPLKSDNKTAIIRASDISGVGSYSYEITYPKTNGKKYLQYISFTDYSDPLQVELISTIGDKLTNGVGEGVVYPQTTRDGNTLDQVSNNLIVVRGRTSTPSSSEGEEGDFAFNTSNNTLYKKGANSWSTNSDYAQIIVLRTGNTNPIELRTLSSSTYPAPSSDSFSDLTYVWSFRDSSGNVVNPQSLTDLKISYINSSTSPTYTTTQVTGGQFVYVNKNVVNNKIIILCQVTKN